MPQTPGSGEDHGGCRSRLASCVTHQAEHCPLVVQIEVVTQSCSGLPSTLAISPGSSSAPASPGVKGVGSGCPAPTASGSQADLARPREEQGTGCWRQGGPPWPGLSADLFRQPEDPADTLQHTRALGGPFCCPFLKPWE